MSDIYETPRLLDEYLLFHYGSDEEILPWANGPREALGFPMRTVTELLPADFPAGGRALDVGCAVGRSTFELTRVCREVVGVDYSRSFIAAARRLREQGEMPYQAVTEGRLTRTLTARPPADARPERARFETGDAMDLPADLGEFDIVHAANLICRLPEPRRFLDRLPSLVKPGGVLLLATPCTWLEEFTPPNLWPDQPGGTFAWLEKILTPRFRLEKKTDLPFLIREHARKFQWSVALGTVWRRK